MFFNHITVYFLLMCRWETTHSLIHSLLVFGGLAGEAPRKLAVGSYIWLY